VDYTTRDNNRLARDPARIGRRQTCALARPLWASKAVGEMASAIPQCWATVNTGDPAEMAEFRVQQERLANERAKAAFERLKSLGIIDEHGASVGEEPPPDMRSGAKRDFGG
jgi:hypothetical protein